MKFHDTLLRLIVGITLISGATSPRAVKADVSQSDAEKREKALATAKNSSDSIKILLDVYTLSDEKNRQKVRSRIINMTSGIDNKELISSVVQELVLTTDVASDLEKLMEISMNIPKESDRLPVETAVHMEQSQVQASNISDSLLERQLADYTKKGWTLTGDPYKEIQDIYRTLMYLGTTSQGPMYFQYLKRLGKLVDELPEEDYAIKNLYYTTAALFYTRKRDYQQALEMDRKLLAELDKMKAIYREKGVEYTDLDYFYYTSYRRMLRNFKGLSPEEVEDIYNKCVELAAQNEQIGQIFGTLGLSKSYYYIAKEQYADAIPQLQKALENQEISKYRRRELLGYLARAYSNTGNEKGELETLRVYTKMMIEDRDERLSEMYRESELKDAVSNRLLDSLIEEEKQKEENREMRKTSITLVYALAVILIFLCQAYFRLRHRVKELEMRNSKLKKNIEHLFDDGVPKGTKDLHHQKNRLKG